MNKIKAINTQITYKIKCPINQDSEPSLCSAGTCSHCTILRRLNYENKRKDNK